MFIFGKQKNLTFNKMKKNQKQQELLNQMDELVRQMRELKDVDVIETGKTSRRRRVAGHVNYYIIHLGNVWKSVEGEDKIDQARFDEGNYFLTSVEAEEELKRRQIVTKVKDRIFELNGGWKCDWRDSGQKKYSFEILSEVMGIDYWFQIKHRSSDLHFKSRKIGEQLLQEFGDDLYYLFR
jgi:hypothetical protein